MRYKKLLCLSALALSSVHVAANDIEPGKEYYTAIRAPQPIVLDGDLSEWSGSAVLADPRFAVPKGSGGASGNLVFFELYDAGGPGTAVWTGPDDHTSAVQIVYDDNNVYFGFVVTDEYHENAANSAWNGDSVQLMIANATRDQQVALYNYALGGVEEELGEVVLMHEAGPAADEACGCATEVVVKRNTTTKRTTYEIKLPKASLGIETLTGGVRFGLGMAINDGDKDAPGQQGWGGLGAHSIVFGKSPGETALVTLAKSNDIEPGKELYMANPAPKPVVLDGNLSEWSGVPVLSDPRFSIPKGSGRSGTPVLFELYDAGGPGTAVWTGPDDHTSAVQIVYDADNIYFGFVVTDEYHENSANSAWNGDSIQLMIANGAQDQQIALYNYALGGIETELGEVVLMHEAGPAADGACNCPTEVVVNRNTTTKRTTYEIKLPKASLGLDTLALGTQFGLGMAINDGDEEAPGQQGWGGLGAHALVFGKSPGETALVTLGVGGTGADLVFLSAINPTLTGFTFRATDKGTSIVDPATAKLIIDDQQVPLTAKPKNLDATDFEYVRADMYPPASDHTYVIEVKDTRGNTVTSAGTFKSAYYAILTKSMQAASVDKTKTGFTMKIFQNETPIGATETVPAALPNSLASAEQALKGELKDDSGTLLENWADATATGPALGQGVKDGPLYRFEIPTVVNLAQTAEELNGNFTPDEQFPGVPGVLGGNDGIDAEFITFVELPAGMVTLGVVSDDSFRAQAGYINNAADAILLGQVDGNTANVTFQCMVKEAGVYPVRVIWQEAAGGAHLELFSVKADGTRVLLNDTANGGYPCYRTGTAPEKPLTIRTYGLGLNFGADEPSGANTGTLAATDTAGVPLVAQANWNNLTGASGTSSTLVADAAGASQSVTTTVTWTSPNTWASTGRGEENNALTGADKNLMLGYLDTGAATTTPVTITGLPDALTSEGYDVYVYLTGGVANKGGGYRIVDADTKEVLKPHVRAQPPVNAPNYVQVVPSADPAVWATGNYIVFSGLNAPNIIVESTTADGLGFGSNPRAPINAIQVIAPPSSTPPPPKPRLSIARSGANIVITYTGTLQSADAVTGAFNDVTGATSPFTVEASASAKFYRAKN